MKTGHPRNDRHRESGQRDRLLLANEKVVRDNEALVFALRETLAILADKSGVFTDAQRVACAKSHVILSLGRWGTGSAPINTKQTTN